MRLNITGPGYTVTDLVYWMGFMIAAGCSYVALRPLELHPILQLLGSIGCGVVAGMACEMLYQRVKDRRPPSDEDEINRIS